MSKNILPLVFLIIYVLLVNAYIISRDNIPFRYSLLIRDYSTLIGYVLILVNYRIGSTAFIGSEFIKMLIGAVIINAILVTLVDHGIIADTMKQKFLTFNGATLLVSVLILFSGIRHGVFKLQNQPNAD